MRGYYVRLLSAKITNFGSWKELEFNFDNIGLALVHGATGSGKSTLLDIVPWILFGITAKGGSVEEIRSWQANGEPTMGTLTVEIAGLEIQVSRIRGAGGKNDLYWTCSTDPDKQIRGKDLNDTQKLLETRLAMSADTCLVGSYYHEFSPTATFFTAKAKDRRELFENVQDLTLPIRLADRCTQAKRTAKDELSGYSNRQSTLVGLVQGHAAQLASLRASADRWDASRLRDIADFNRRAETFETEKTNKIKDLEAKSQAWEEKALVKINQLTTRLQELETMVRPLKEFELEEAKARNEARCQACGALPQNLSDLLEKIVERKFNNNQYIAELKSSKRELKELGSAINPHQGALGAALTEVNTYADKAKEAEAQENPFTQQVKDTEQALQEAEAEKADTQALLDKAQHRYDSLSHLYDLSFELRGYLINKAMKEIQDQTNRYLEAYFDAEIRVTLSSQDADNLYIGLQKSGYDCVFTQLSKGQQQLLRLCFSLAVMKATANNSGTHFSTIMLDEPTDGLDTNLKLKALRLLQELATDHSSVLVIDHSPDLALHFNRKYHISLCGDYSQLEFEGD